MKEIIIKIVFSTFLITLCNYTITFVAAKYLPNELFGSIAYINSIIAIMLQISLMGFNYEILRYGSEKNYTEGRYFIQLKSVVFCIIVLIFSVLIMKKYSHEISSFPNHNLLYVISIALFFVALNSSVLRSLGNYIFSNF